MDFIQPCDCRAACHFAPSCVRRSQCFDLLHHAHRADGIMLHERWHLRQRVRRRHLHRQRYLPGSETCGSPSLYDRTAASHGFTLLASVTYSCGLYDGASSCGMSALSWFWRYCYNCLPLMAPPRRCCNNPWNTFCNAPVRPLSCRIALATVESARSWLVTASAPTPSKPPASQTATVRRSPTSSPTMGERRVVSPLPLKGALSTFGGLAPFGVASRAAPKSLYSVSEKRFCRSASTEV